MGEEFVLSQVARDVQKAIDNALSPDKTLSVNGKPADAKAVGTAISQLSEEIGDIDTALDAIIAMQNSYIGGEGA